MHDEPLITESTVEAGPQPDALESALDEPSLKTDAQVSEPLVDEASIETADNKAIAPDAKPEPIPETYDFKFLADQNADPKLIEGLTACAKHLGLTQTQATQLAELNQTFMQHTAEQQAKQSKEYLATSQRDTEFGGHDFNANVSLASRALKTLAPGLIPVLQAQGIANHPEVIRAFYRMSQELGPDRFIGGAREAAALGLKDIIYTTP